MYKKIILAAAVTAASGAGQAATWVNDGPTGQLFVLHGQQEVAGTSEVGGVVQSNGLVRLGSEYAVADKITFTYSVAKASGVSFPQTMQSLVPADLTGSNTTSGTASSTNASGVLTTDSVANRVVGHQFTLSASPTVIRRVLTDTSGTAAATDVQSASAAGFITYLNPKGINWQLDSFNSTSATYRVASFLGTGSSTVNTLVLAPSPNLSPAGLVAAGTTGATVSFSAQSAAGTAFDALATATTTAKALAEFTMTTVTAFDGIVDVENARKTFTVATDPGGGALASTTSSDKYEFLIAQTTAVDGQAVKLGAVAGALTHLDVAVAGAKLSIPGDFNFLDNTAATAGIQLKAASAFVLSNNNSGTQIGTNVFGAAGYSNLTASPWLIGGTKQTVDITSLVTGATITPQVFSPNVVLTYTTDEQSGNLITVTPTTAAGSFTLNGASITAYAVPMGGTVSRFLWVTNANATAAAISATVTSGGTSYGPYVLSSAAAKASTEVGSQIDAALTAAGVVLAANSRANILITTPLKSSNVTMSAAYKHIGDADRLIIETSDSLD